MQGFQLQASPSHPTLELELSHALSRTGALPQGAQPGSTSALSRVCARKQFCTCDLLCAFMLIEHIRCELPPLEKPS